MSNSIDIQHRIQHRDYGRSLYLLPFGFFALLLTMRNSESFGYIFESLPVLGRTLPFFVLDALLLWVFIFRGGTLERIGLCWPRINKTKFGMIRWMVCWAVGLLLLRIFVAVASEPLLELLPPKISRSSPLAGNLALLLTLLPFMWLVVIGEEVVIRGLLMGFLARLFGDTSKAWLLAALFAAIIFGLGHMGKGYAGMIGSGLAGLVFGLGYIFCGRNLWPVILAHCAGNTIGFVDAYFNN